MPFVMGSFSQMTHSWWYLLMVCNFSKARSLTVGYIFGLSLSCPQTINTRRSMSFLVQICNHPWSQKNQIHQIVSVSRFSSPFCFAMWGPQDMGFCLQLWFPFTTNALPSTSANYFVLYKSVDHCTVSIAPQLGPGWTVSPNGNLTMQSYVQLWKVLLQKQTIYYAALSMTVQYSSI